MDMKNSIGEDALDGRFCKGGMYVTTCDRSLPTGSGERQALEFFKGGAFVYGVAVFNCTGTWQIQIS